MLKKIVLFYILMIGGNLLAQTPAEVSPQAEQALAFFNTQTDVASANRFFERLDSEEFTEQKLQFPATTPADTLRAQVWYWAAEYYYAAGRYHEAGRMDDPL